MKERPILFSAPMVRAILAGKKTQTRRVVKPALPALLQDPSPDPCDPSVWCAASKGAEFPLRRCPYGVPGDRLWVRETWRRGPDGRVFFRADSHEVLTPWRPGIHLRRVDARITLEVTEVRVQRLRDISEEDARAEGVEASADVELRDGSPCYSIPFQKLWRAINGVDNPADWDRNPWVWCVSFKRVAAEAARAA